MTKKTFVLLAVIIIVAMLLVACEDPNILTTEGSDSVQVNWVPVNPPPGHDGPCWAYFMWAEQPYRGYSGVYCDP